MWDLSSQFAPLAATSVVATQVLRNLCCLSDMTDFLEPTPTPTHGCDGRSGMRPAGSMGEAQVVGGDNHKSTSQGQKNSKTILLHA